MFRIQYLGRLQLPAPVLMAFMLQGNSREVVAVKVVGKKTLNKASTENLLTEIEILKTVRHPHIVQLKDFQVTLLLYFFLFFNVYHLNTNIL